PHQADGADLVGRASPRAGSSVASPHLPSGSSVASPHLPSGSSVASPHLPSGSSVASPHRGPYLALLLSLALAHVCSAATITGSILNTSGNAYATNVLFAPLSTPLAIGANTIASTSTNVVAAADGSFSVSLKQGNYLVTLGNLR